jgi:hypothetical protein
LTCIEMGNSEFIKDIKEGFNNLNSSAGGFSVKENISNITRSINRLRTEDKNVSLHLKKIAADILGAYTCQVQYSQLRNKSENPGLHVKPEFDAGFFESLAILKAELFEVLEKI